MDGFRLPDRSSRIAGQSLMPDYLSNFGWAILQSFSKRFRLWHGVNSSEQQRKCARRELLTIVKKRF
jgi:hypothetical protein